MNDSRDAIARATEAFDRLMRDLYPSRPERAVRLAQLQARDVLAFRDDSTGPVPAATGADADAEQAAPVPVVAGSASVDVFAELEPEVRHQAIAAAVPRTYRAGQPLFVGNDPGDSLIILRGGAVAVFHTSPAGVRTVLGVMRPPDAIADVSLLDSAVRSLSAEAIEDCRALALPRNAFIELVHADPRFLDAVLRDLVALIRRSTEQNTDHVGLDLPGRVAKTLVRLVGDSRAPIVTIEVNLSQFAEMVGGSRQSINQAIGSFADRGWLRTEGRRIVITDIPALRRRAGLTERRAGPESPAPISPQAGVATRSSGGPGPTSTTSTSGPTS
jgi:CRP-like cAMP-binding protein